MQDTKSTQQHIEEDEIDLRELFSTIGRYKWSIIIFTLLITFGVAIKVYFMPKYYKSTVILEVKPEDNKAAGFSIGGAAAMLLGGDLGGSTSLDKDVALLKTFRTNKKVLDKTNAYMIRYFITNEKHKEIELENNISINITDITINNYKLYGMRVIIEPLNNTQYKLILLTKFSSKEIGLFHYSELVEYLNPETKKIDFSLMVHKNYDFSSPITVQLAGTKHYVYDQIINKNLTIEADKKSPFITISYLDNLPNRGESYLRNLIEIYTKQSIEDIKNESSLIIDSYDRQISKIEKEVQKSARKLVEYKSKHGILEPKLQAGVLVEEFSKVNISIAQNNYKQDLIKNLIVFAKKHNNIDSIAPSLVDLEDTPTIKLIELIQKQQLKLSNLLLKYKPSHPQVVTTQQIINNLKSKIISNLENLKQTLKDKARSLTKMKNNYTKQLKSAPKNEQEIVSFTRDYKVNEKLYLYLMQERSSAKLTHDKARGRFKIIEEIYTPDNAAKPNKALIVIITFITSMLLMVLIAFFRNFLKKDKEKSE